MTLPIPINLISTIDDSKAEETDTSRSRTAAVIETEAETNT